MKILHEHSLQAYNTFGIDVSASIFIPVGTENDFIEALEEYKDLDKRILGGGSNILLTEDFDGVLLKNEIKGIQLITEDEESVLIEVGGGENWHELVMWAVDNRYGGIENLSLIPGTVGAAPIQNIGAYGVELKDVFQGLNAISLETGEEHIFSVADCQLAYRDSIFKRRFKGQFFISRVYIQLTKYPHHIINTSYGAIQNAIAEKNKDKEITIKDVSDAVISIRQSKLPNPRVLGNSGSFFKNIELAKEDFEQLKKEFPQVPRYLLEDDQVKVPTAWLIDQCGFKGMIHGNTGCFKNQPLVLVNRGGASGKEVLDFSKMIQAAVKEKFGLDISPEVNIW